MRTGQVFIAVATIFYLIVTGYKLWIIGSSARVGARYKFTPEQIAAEGDRDWPIYSILIPMYKEPEVLPQMLRALLALDYPLACKDVQFLLEEDDVATLEAARALDMPPEFRVTVIPESFPRTKPKACNIGLALAKGEYLVIYDAEDKPEPDQLKKAVMSFERASKKVVCIQSSLNFYNSGHNWLTRFFAGDYSAWFDLQLPGLAARNAVIPLGGTSNHFRTSVLRELHGWDAYNVTEDCDLGVRLCRAGYLTSMLETTTWEEACSSLPFWIRQRTRWIKGYIQTYFVHMRNPWRLWRELGTVNFIHFQILIGGVFVSFMLNPIFWVMALAWFAIRPVGLDALFPGPIFAAGTLCLFVGNFLFIYINLLGCYRRRYDRIMWFNLLTPFYWMLMSVSGWRAFFQFFSNPFLWEKTQHALHANTGGQS
jgi:cellulose synthase/poly-beta-1,6-N-acetylglucosamine synthase-like glycosyltransferase